MSWVINIDFQDGGGNHDISSLVLIDTIRRTRTLHNNLKPTVDTLKFSMHRNTSYINSLLANDSETIISVTKDGSDYFTGTIRPNFTVTVGSIVGQVKVECVGYAEKLKKTINTTFAYGSYKVSDATTKTSSIIHQLLVLAGFHVDNDISIPTIDKTIDYFVNIGGKDSRTYWDVITKLLFEFGYVWYFDESGVFKVYDFLPADTSTSDAFNNDNMRGQLTIKRKLDDYKGVEVTWYPHETEEDAIIFSDTTGGNSTSKCNIEIAADGHYPEGAESANVYSEYQYDGYNIVIVNNAALDVTKDANIASSFTSYYQRALVTFHNSAESAKNITKFDITGDVVYQGDQQKTQCLLEAGTEKIDSYDAEFITASADADKLSIGLARYYLYSDFTYIINSETDYSLGAFVDVVDTMLGIDNRCVVVKIEDIDQTQGLKKYTLYGISDYSAETTSLEAVKVTPPPPPPGADVSESDITSRPTYIDLIDGFTDTASGGTIIPTVPTISVCKGIFRGITLSWDRQANLTNFARYEVQVSNNDSTWYSLQLDGTDWKDTVDEDTDWLNEFLVHSNIPFDVSGGTDDPAGVTLYYRVRRVTKASAVSSWSSSAHATTKTLDTGDYGVNSIQVNNLIVGALQAMFAVITNELIVGHEGTGTYDDPDEGDRHGFINGAAFGSAEYTGGAWSSANQIKFGGVDSNGNYAPFSTCQGIINPLADAPSTEYFPSSTFRVFNFENNVEDHHGVDDWSSKSNVAYNSSNKKFGSYSLWSSSGAYATLHSAEEWTPGESQAAGCWFYPEAIGAGVSFELIGYYAISGMATDQIKVGVSSTGIYYYVEKYGTPTTSSIATTISLNTWHYLALVYDADDDKLYVIFDDSVTEISSLSGSWGTATSSYIHLKALRAYSSTTVSIDEALFAPDITVNPDIFAQHYTHNVAWVTDYSREDIVLLPGTNGNVKAPGRWTVDTLWTGSETSGTHSLDSGKFSDYDLLIFSGGYSDDVATITMTPAWFIAGKRPIASTPSRHVYFDYTSDTSFNIPGASNFSAKKIEGVKL